MCVSHGSQKWCGRCIKQMAQFDSLAPEDIVYGIAQVYHQRITGTAAYTLDDVETALDFLPFELRERVITLLTGDAEFNNIPNKVMRALDRYLERYRRKKKRYASSKRVRKGPEVESDSDEEEAAPVNKKKSRDQLAVQKYHRGRSEESRADPERHEVSEEDGDKECCIQ